MSQYLHDVWGCHQSQINLKNYCFLPHIHTLPQLIIIPLHLHVTLTLTHNTNTPILLSTPRIRYFALPPSIKDNTYF